MLQELELEAYRRAGKLLAEVRERIRPMVRVGESLVRIAEEAERLIQEKGAKPAFPCNVSLNEVAAHYSPPADDPTVIREGDLVKVDLGAHLDGYIADTAFTVATDEEGEKLKEAAERALEAAIAGGEARGGAGGGGEGRGGGRQGRGPQARGQPHRPQPLPLDAARRPHHPQHPRADGAEAGGGAGGGAGALRDRRGGVRGGHEGGAHLQVPSGSAR